jgi:hypothetical protein
MENKVSVKYKTKNIITEGNAVFLITINHINTNTNSSRNLIPIANNMYKVWLSGSLLSPMKKMISVIMEIREKTGNNINTSPRLILRLVRDLMK